VVVQTSYDGAGHGVKLLPYDGATPTGLFWCTNAAGYCQFAVANGNFSIMATNTTISNVASTATLTVDKTVKGTSFLVVPQTITCATSGDGNHSTCGGAQAITSDVVQLVCDDADGCTLTLAETGYSATVSGRVTLIGPAANHVDVADSAGVVELAGGAAMAMDALDSLTLVYAPAALAWVETSRAAN
jgi:hypothetical protein